MSDDSLDIFLLGLNHDTASVELRECLALDDDETPRALAGLHECSAVCEALVLSTCNRVEILATSEDLAAAEEQVKDCLAELKHSPRSRFENALYGYRGEAAVRHVFRVAASLDSMMVGEPQILGQLKAAYASATRMKTTGVVLNRLLHRAFFVAKRVRSETGIGDHAVSISFAAVELARKIFGSLEGRRVLLIGAGEMAELAVEHLIRNRAGDILVANRTFARGVDLARRFGGQALRLEEIEGELSRVDIIIASTGSPETVIGKKQVKAVMRHRRNRPLFFIDIAVPRDVDPAVNRLQNCYVYDIDDLKGVIDENIEDRRREAVKGERIVDEAVIRFRQWYDSLGAVPTIVALRTKMESIARREVKKTLAARPHLNENDARALERMTTALINKILHDPTRILKGDGRHREKAEYLDWTRRLFNLDD